MADQIAELASNATLPGELVNAMHALFGKHFGYRTTHAKGLLVEGVFTPTEQAQDLSIAAHFNRPSTPVVARFSVGGGIPHIPDVDDGATPKGVAIRFNVDPLTHTDLVSHSFNGFATKNGEDFLAFLKIFRAFQVAKSELEKAKAGGGDYSKEQKNFDKVAPEFQAFLGSHPSAAVFVQSPKPNPLNYGTLTYYEPNTHVLTNKEGKTINVRYRLDPEDGEHLYPNDKDQLDKLGSNYLEDDLRQRFPEKPIVLNIVAHIANSDDILDDATVPYKSTTFVPVGKVVINKVMDFNDIRQQEIAFSPTPDLGGIKGITASKDPLIQTRKGVYWISAEQRRHEVRLE
ncbi:catalase-like domain-containing protein [Xylaria telfairii]|nr:catalase-like domain-containing protein [Xylaria telfairii]